MVLGTRVSRLGAVHLEEASGPPVVALVCSAGGLEALFVILEQLPPGFSAPVIVLRHQSPDRASRLPKVLARHCALPVVAAVQGMELRQGTIVVVPPGFHALATNENRLALISSDGPPPSRPSADLLLTSFALVAGPARSP